MAKAMLFTSDGRFVNVSRADPSTLAMSKDNHISIEATGKLATCISTGLVTASYLSRSTTGLVRHGVYMALETLQIR